MQVEVSVSAVFVFFFENAQVEVLNVQVKINPVEAALVACPSSYTHFTPVLCISVKQLLFLVLNIIEISLIRYQLP